MGLDQYIEHVDLDEELFYYRKVNQLQNYFEDKHDIDNCGKVILTENIVKDILNRVNQVLENNELAEELFPTTNGFFYGGTDYDEYYYNIIKVIKENMNKLLNDYSEDLSNGKIYYTCWY